MRGGKWGERLKEGGWEGIGRESDGHRWRENAQNRRPPFCHRTATPQPESRAIFRYTFLSHFRAANERFLRFSLPISLFFFCLFPSVKRTLPLARTRTRMRAGVGATTSRSFRFENARDFCEYFPIIRRPRFVKYVYDDLKKKIMLRYESFFCDCMIRVQKGKFKQIHFIKRRYFFPLLVKIL